MQLRLGNDGVSTEVNGIKVSRPANPGFGGLSATWVVKTAYFGGQETAPKNLTVMVKDLSVN